MNVTTWSKRPGGRREASDAGEAATRAQPRDIRRDRAEEATRARHEAAVRGGLTWQVTWSKLRNALADAVEQSPVPLQIVDQVHTIEIIRPADPESLERRAVVESGDGQRITLTFSARLDNHWTTCQDPERATYSGAAHVIRVNGWVRTPTETAAYVLRRLQE